jgi:hypothetical protein
MNPTLAAAIPRDREYIFLPWDQLPRSGGYAFLYGLLGILFGILAYRWLGRWWRRREARQRFEELFAHLCRSRGIGTELAAALRRALRSSRVSSPVMALENENYFDSLVGPILRRERGEAAVERLRHLLFHPATEQETAAEGDADAPPAGGTRELQPCQRLRLTGPHQAGEVPAVVVSVTEEDFLVGVDEAEPELHLETHDEVDGSFNEGNSLFSFHTRVLDAAPGMIYLVRLAHTPHLNEIRHRAATRIRVGGPLQFVHVPAVPGEGGEGGGERALGAGRAPLDGVLEDISVGGASIRTAAGRDFEPGDFVYFRCHLSARVKPIRCSGRIVALGEAGEGEALLHVQFQGLGSAARHLLGRLVAVVKERQKGGPAGGAPAE